MELFFSAYLPKYSKFPYHNLLIEIRDQAYCPPMYRSIIKVILRLNPLDSK